MLILFLFLFFGRGKKTEERLPNTVTELDLRQLVQLVERKDGGQAWIQMMDRFTPGMRYQAWLREPKVTLVSERERDLCLVTLMDCFFSHSFVLLLLFRMVLLSIEAELCLKMQLLRC